MKKNQLLNGYIAKLLNCKKQFNKKTIKQSKLGFTLIEVMVVIAIIGSLAGLTTFSLQSGRDKGNDTKRKADLKAIQTAAVAYYQDHNQYPPDPATSANTAFSSDSGGNWIPGLESYINKTPKDPKQAGILYFLADTAKSGIQKGEHLVAGLFTKPQQKSGTTVTPQVAAAASVTLTANSTDDYQRRKNATNPPDAGICDLYPSANRYFVGQARIVDYYAYRGYLTFDTSSIPAGSTINSATLQLTVESNQTLTDFTLRARNYDWGNSSDCGDWGGNPPTATEIGTFNTTGLPAVNSPFSITISTSAINIGGLSTLMLTGSRDELNNAPCAGCNEYVGLYSANEVTASYRPQLTINYTQPIPQDDISPWTPVDVGTPLAGGQALVSSGNYDIYGDGTDIWDPSDNFRFAYQTPTGDFTAIAQITSIDNTDAWAKAGLMVRSTTANNSANLFMAISPSNGIDLQYRPTTGSTNTYVNCGAGAAPKWVKITATAGSYSVFFSDNGTAWTQCSTALSLNFGATPLVGMAVTSHNGAAVAKAQFRNVSLTYTPNNPPTNGTASSPACVNYGTPYRFTTTVSDPDGFATILYSYIMINDTQPYDATTPPVGAFVALLNNQTHEIGIWDGTAWQWSMGGMIGNSYATINTWTSIHFGWGNMLTTYWDITINSAWQPENANVWIKVSDGTTTTSYTSGSTVQIPCPAIPPTITTLTPAWFTSSTAQLYATANPNGFFSLGWFRYSQTSPGAACNDTFGTRVPASGGLNLGSWTSPGNFGQAVSGLSASTTYYVCALGSNSNGTGMGLPVSFTTSAAAGAPTGTISAAQTSIPSGSSTTITWSSTNATSCTVTPPGWTGTSGSQSTDPLTSSQTYTLNCSGPGGNSAPESVTVSISAPPTADIKADGSDSPISVDTGNSVIIDWTSTDTTTCTVTGGSGGSGTSGSFTWTATTTNTTFSISCTGPGGTATDSVVVNINVVSTCPNIAFTYCYLVTADRSSFVIWAQLDDTNDPQIYNGSSATCTLTPPVGVPTSVFNYCLDSSTL